MENKNITEAALPLDAKKFVAMTDEERANIPWDHQGMVLVKDRYYYGQFNVALPRLPGVFPLGADITGLIWRYDAKPDEWIVTHRLRVYLDDLTTIDSKDVRLWTANKFQGTIEQVLMAITKEHPILPDPEMGITVNWVLGEGDNEKMGKALLEAAKTSQYLHATNVEKK